MEYTETNAEVLELQVLNESDDTDPECVSLISGCFSFKSDV